MLSQIATLAEKVGNQLNQIGINVATAESCTAGGLSYWLTHVPGSSAWFERGFITYSNAAKVAMLGVANTAIQQYGAVSKEVAIAMALGALHHSQASVAIAITGIAGPGGGTAAKPVGTVWIAMAGRNIVTQTRLFSFSGNRESVRLQSIVGALEMLLTINQQAIKS